MKSVSVVINARTTSTRVPNKLLKPFAGSCLLEIALEKLNRMDFFENRFLAVAEDELKAIGAKYPNVKILPRESAAIKKGVNPLHVTFGHYLNVPSDYIFVFNPCLPCMTVETIKKAYDYFQKTSYNSYTAVIPTGEWIFSSDGTALTNSDPRNVTTNKNQSFLKAIHAFHIHNKKFFESEGVLWTFNKNDPHLIEVPEDQAIDVDTPIEFELAELIYKRDMRK
jgi:CMP-N-acetylneuraminic acid synthetase